MTLPVTPNAISLSQVNTEMNRASDTQISLNQDYCTALSGQTGPYDMNTLHGKARSSGTTTITTGSGSFTVPLGVVALTISITGGKGGRGGTDVHAGQIGWAGDTVAGTIAVSYGQVYSYWCGGNGGNGVNGANAAGGAAGVSTSPVASGSVNFSGGRGGNSGTYPSSNSGSGGGGGGASGLYLGTTPIAIAGGGGGGAGAGSSGGVRGQSGLYTTTTVGGAGKAPVNADFGGDGAGGGGYPLGGLGGTYQAQDYDGQPGTSGKTLAPVGCTDTAGLNAVTTYTACVSLSW